MPPRSLGPVDRFYGFVVVGIRGANSGLGEAQVNLAGGALAAKPPAPKAPCFDGIAPPGAAWLERVPRRTSGCLMVPGAASPVQVVTM